MTPAMTHTGAYVSGVLIACVLAGCQRGNPLEPTPPLLPELPGHTERDHTGRDHDHPVLTVTIRCETHDCASLRPRARVTLRATVTGDGSGHYGYRWSASAGTLYGSPGRDGTMRWVAPRQAGPHYVTVLVSDTVLTEMLPVEEEITVVVAADPEPDPDSDPDSTAPAALTVTVSPATVAAGGLAVYLRANQPARWTRRTGAVTGFWCVTGPDTACKGTDDTGAQAGREVRWRADSTSPAGMAVFQATAGGQSRTVTVTVTIADGG